MTRAAFLIVLLVSACEAPLEKVAYCGSPSGDPLAASEFPTWEGGIRALVEQRCGACHQEDGPTPLVIANYDDVVAAAARIHDAVLTREMPPWGAVPCCRKFKDDRFMPDEERALLLAWLEGGMPAGSDAPSTLAPPPRPQLSRVDLTLEMPESFTPEPIDGTEEERCFMVDWPEDKDRYLTGIDIEPGARAAVHHALIYHPTDAQEIAQYEELDEKDPRPGWACEGAKLGASTLLPPAGLGGYSPGTYPRDFPEGLGVRVPMGGKVIFQMHYTIDHGVLADRSKVHLKLDDKVDSEIFLLTITDSRWPYSPGAFVIPAGDEEKHYQVTQPLSVWSGPWNHIWPLRLYTATLHMHQFGARGRLSVKHQDGSEDCLLEIPAWDYELGGHYWLDDPLLVQPGDDFFLECVFNNSPEHQPVENGTRREPRDLTWDEDGEMCVGFVSIAGEPIY